MSIAIRCPYLRSVLCERLLLNALYALADDDVSSLGGMGEGTLRYGLYRARYLYVVDIAHALEGALADGGDGGGDGERVGAVLPEPLFGSGTGVVEGMVGDGLQSVVQLYVFDISWVVAGRGEGIGSDGAAVGGEYDFEWRLVATEVGRDGGPHAFGQNESAERRVFEHAYGPRLDVAVGQELEPCRRFAPGECAGIDIAHGRRYAHDVYGREAFVEHYGAAARGCA